MKPSDGRLIATGFASGAWGNASIQELALNNRLVMGVLAGLDERQIIGRSVIPMDKPTPAC